MGPGALSLDTGSLRAGAVSVNAACPIRHPEGSLKTDGTEPQRFKVSVIGASLMQARPPPVAQSSTASSKGHFDVTDFKGRTRRPMGLGGLASVGAGGEASLRPGPSPLAWVQMWGRKSGSGWAARAGERWDGAPEPRRAPPPGVVTAAEGGRVPSGGWLGPYASHGGHPHSPSQAGVRKPGPSRAGAFWGLRGRQDFTCFL